MGICYGQVNGRKHCNYQKEYVPKEEAHAKKAHHQKAWQDWELEMLADESANLGKLMELSGRTKSSVHSKASALHISTAGRW